MSKCIVCGKPAVVHLTQIMGQKVHKIDLCEACAAAKGVTDPEGSSIVGMISKALTWAEHMAAEAPSAVQELSCPSCGYTLHELRETGRLGCPECYKTFAEPLKMILDEIHQHSNHTGKVAQTVLSRSELSDRLEGLKTALAKAIADERFEEAAQYRDEIKVVEHSIEHAVKG
ncbi:MAG TPA: UvrB/UvrC motif-containing protein [Opitutales bacterium]|nr:UvrB/UvrC motif-containing protein [Opitutales bacterium]